LLIIFQKRISRNGGNDTSATDKMECLMDDLAGHAHLNHNKFAEKQNFL